MKQLKWFLVTLAIEEVGMLLVGKEGPLVKLVKKLLAKKEQLEPP